MNEGIYEPILGRVILTAYGECLESAGSVKVGVTVVTVGNALKNIWRFIETSYLFNSNPLPTLRRHFPYCEWNHHNLIPRNGIEWPDKSEKRLQEVIKNSDYIFNLQGCNQLVTIRPSGYRRVSHSLCIDHSIHWDSEKKCFRQQSDGTMYTFWNTGLISPVGGKAMGFTDESTGNGLAEIPSDF